MARRRKSPVAHLWQVWVKSAAEGKGYWLHAATPDIAKAQRWYDELRAAYLMAELRTPLGDIYRSHDKDRDPTDEAREDLRWRYDVAEFTKK